MKYFRLLSLGLVASATILSSYTALASIVKPTKGLAGFSPDNRHYIYLESFRDTVSEIPKAQIQIVNVATNSCVQKGCLETEYSKEGIKLPVKAAESNLLNKTLTIRQQLGLNYLKTGIKLPIIARKNLGKTIDRVSARLPNGDTLEFFLQQQAMRSTLYGGQGDVDKAAMRLVVFDKYSRLTIGSLNNFREAVLKYTIRDVFLSPNRRNVVVLIDMTKTALDGVVQTTLVQSFPL